jgi:hypothetical protein
MIKLDTFGPGDFQVGDIIRSRNFEWKVVSVEGNRFSTLHRSAGSNEEFSTYMTGWYGFEFSGNEYTHFRPYKEIPYDPSQQGDREDDI